ncbi:MAG TPA: hypothetical protein VNF28_04465 [Candidatus Binataceae bacterium]|nr:hypothetical protein [Candidatus Binataceae bacterium]
MERERPSRAPRRLTGWRRATCGFIAIARLAACAIALGGCWPFNRTPPQQEYFNALKMGNSAQASQLWLQMTPDQRAKFERGEGVRPSVSHNDVQQAIDEHYAEQDENGSAPKQAEPASGAGAGLQNLQDLPSYLKTNGSAGAPQPAPSGQP